MTFPLLGAFALFEKRKFDSFSKVPSLFLGLVKLFLTGLHMVCCAAVIATLLIHPVGWTVLQFPVVFHTSICFYFYRAGSFHGWKSVNELSDSKWLQDLIERLDIINEQFAYQSS